MRSNRSPCVWGWKNLLTLITMDVLKWILGLQSPKEYLQDQSFEIWKVWILFWWFEFLWLWLRVSIDTIHMAAFHDDRQALV